MGKRIASLRKATIRRIRSTPLSAEEAELLSTIDYEGSPYHKRVPGNFNLPEPPRPRHDKTLCDEAEIFTVEQVEALKEKALEQHLVSEATTVEGFPKQIWVVDESGNVFEAMHGGSQNNTYHGYPIRESDPLADEVRAALEG